MVGACLIAVFAIAAVVATSASAVKLKGGFAIYKACPVNAEDPSWRGERPKICVYAFTNKGEGGSYTVGNITVPLTKPIVLQYGIAFRDNEETEELEELYVPPTGGLEGITPTPEKVPGEPFANISEAEQEEMGWPAGLRNRYREGQRKHTVNAVTETIELAGTPVTSRNNIIFEEGVGVEAPVKIKGENKWLSSLGDACYIGSDAEPVIQRLTTGTSTSPLTGETIQGGGAQLEFFHKGGSLGITSTLVDNTYAVPGATCTGPYSSYIEAAIDKVFGVPAVAGASKTELLGQLYDGYAPAVKEALGL